MNFLERFDPDDQAIMLRAASELELPDGQHLIRRGEPGGDIYFLLDGNLEVVDTRSHPELILAVMEKGAVVGEIAFVDNAPRSADVRAQGACRVLHWTREDLHALLEEHDHLAATLYRNLALLAVSRARSATHTAVAGARRATEMPTAGIAAVQAQARQIAEAAKEVLLTVEPALRTEPDNPLSVERLQDLLGRLEEDMLGLVRSAGEHALVLEGARVVRRELQPYLTRAELGSRCLASPDENQRLLEVLSHVHGDVAAGDGGLGTTMDQWLLDRPTLASLRSITLALVGQAELGAKRVLVINAGGSHLADRVLEVLRGTEGATLTVIDQSRQALVQLRNRLTSGDGVEVHLLQQNLAQLAMGSSRHALDPQDLVLVEGMVEYLPDRLVVSLLRGLRRYLAPGGTLVAGSLRPSPDAAFLDHLLSWPTVRRSAELAEVLLGAAGLVPEGCRDLGEAGCLLRSRPGA